MSQNPNHDLTEPFKLEVIEKNAKALLRRDRFDRDRLPESDSDDDEPPPLSAPITEGDPTDGASEAAAPCATNWKAASADETKKMLTLIEVFIREPFESGIPPHCFDGF